MMLYTSGSILQIFKLFDISSYKMNFVWGLSRQGEKPSHPYMSWMDLSPRRGIGVTHRVLSLRYCRANNFGPLNGTLVVGEKVNVCQTSHAHS